MHNLQILSNASDEKCMKVDVNSMMQCFQSITQSLHIQLWGKVREDGGWTSQSSDSMSGNPLEFVTDLTVISSKYFFRPDTHTHTQCVHS